MLLCKFDLKSDGISDIITYMLGADVCYARALATTI